MNKIARHMRNSQSLAQLLRYGIIGLVSNLTGYIVYLLITHFGVAPTIAMTILYLVGAVIGFFGNKNLTFAHKGGVLGAGVRYVVAHCFGYLINLSILVFMVDVLGYPHQWVQAAAIFIVAGFLFLMFKFFVFAEADNSIGRI
jgi:putative flippase GtrA